MINKILNLILDIINEDGYEANPKLKAIKKIIEDFTYKHKKSKLKIMEKIIQISTTNNEIFALTDRGNIYKRENTIMCEWILLNLPDLLDKDFNTEL